MSDIQIRPALKQDAADLAILDNLAGHGIPLMFWQELTHNDRLEDAIAFGRERLADDNGFYNWKKGRMAVVGDCIAGMHMSYIMPEPDDEVEIIKQTSQAFRPVFELYAMCQHHWFIDALAVYPCHQNRGVGKTLFQDSLAMGKASPAKTMSLIVEDTNTTALKIYTDYGFEIIDQRDFVSFDGAMEINEWLLMSRTLQ